MKYIISYIFLFLITTPTFAQGNASILDADIFFSEDTYTQVRLSPNGQSIAFIKNENGAKNLYIIDNLKNIESSRRIDNTDNHSIFTFQWSNDSKSILYISEKDDLYNISTLTNIGQEQEYNYHIYSEITNTPRIIHLSSKNPDLGYVAFKTKNSYIERLYQVNLSSGGFSSTPHYFLGAEDYYFDHDDKLRLLTSWSENHQKKYTIAALPDYAFDTIITTHSFEKTKILSWNEDNTEVIFGTNTLSEDLYGLYSYNFDNKKISLIQQDPKRKNDLHDIYLDPVSGNITGTTYYSDQAIVHWKDETWKAIYDSIQTSFPQSNIKIKSISNQLQKIIFNISSDTILSDYYLYDTSTKETKFLLSQNPTIKGIQSQLSNTNPIVYKSKDGREITGYITLPNQKRQKKLPLVVLIHDQIYHDRVYKEFLPFVQFLASRGFAIFQPNFRGSVGFGKEFLKAGFTEWGKAIQEDIHAGVQHLLNQKVAHPKKIAIMGSGHGGYEALMGLIQYPQLYTTAVDINGLLDLSNYVKAVPEHWNHISQDRIKSIGNPYTQQGKAALKKTSPFYLANEIQHPILIVQSKSNPHVTLNETNLFAKEVEAHKKRKKRKKVSYLITEKDQDELAVYSAVESFLLNTLKVRHSSNSNTNIKNKIDSWKVNLDEIEFFDATQFKADSFKLSRPWMRDDEFKFNIKFTYDGMTHDILSITRSYNREGKDRWKIHDNTQAGQLEKFYYTRSFQPIHREVYTNNNKEEWTYVDGKIYLKTKYGENILEAPASFFINGIGVDYIIGRLPLSENFKMNTYWLDEYSNAIKPSTIEVIGTEDIDYYKHFIVKITNLLNPENHITFWIGEESKLMSKSVHQIPSLGNLIITTTKQ